jgi:two-component system, cell cycle sensor histidine kinase and response regulator CckA
MIWTRRHHACFEAGRPLFSAARSRVAVRERCGHIYLPRIDEGVTPEVPEPPLPARGWETILLVEDEASLRAVAREILQEHGYRVLVAASGGEALEMSRSHPEPIHLLLTDVVMPGMNGRALAELLVAARTDLGVLYMSGYTNDVLASNGVLAARSHLIEKPFTGLELLDRVRAAIGPRGGGGNT